MRCCDCSNSYEPRLVPYVGGGGRYMCKCHAWKKGWKMLFFTECKCKRFTSKIHFSLNDAMGYG